MSAYRIPCRVWPSPSIDPARVQQLARRVSIDALVETPSAAVRAPAIVLLTPSDLAGSHREERLALVERAAPGRPVLLDAPEHRDVLLEALNVWRVVAVTRSDARIEELVQCIRTAHERLELSAALAFDVERLRKERTRLQRTRDDIDEARLNLLHADRLTTVGRLVGTLLDATDRHSAVMQRLEDAASVAVHDAGSRRMLANAGESSRAVGALLDEMRAFATGTERASARRAEMIDPVVAQVVDFARFDEHANGRNLLSSLNANAWVRIDRYALYQVLLNLIRNALQATRDGGRVEIRTVADARTVTIEVLDNGVGVPLDIRERLFEPFVSSRGLGGLGLGLQTSRRIIERHDGHIRYDDRAGGGSRFVIHLPRVRPAGIAPPSNPPDAAP